MNFAIVFGPILGPPCARRGSRRPFARVFNRLRTATESTEWRTITSQHVSMSNLDDVVDLRDGYRAGLTAPLKRLHIERWHIFRVAEQSAPFYTLCGRLGSMPASSFTGELLLENYCGKCLTLYQERIKMGQP